MIRDEQKLFLELNNKLNDSGISMSLICVGGFVLDYYGLRGTIDIDAFYSETVQINKLIREIGDKYHLNTPDELWLNNSVQNLNSRPPEEICKTIYDYSNLKVLIPPLEYIAGMKLVSGRDNDIEDVASIIKYLDIRDINEFKHKLASYDFGDLDDALIIDSFGIAYGMDWLKNYYMEHEEELLESIDNNHNNFTRNQESSIQNPKSHSKKGNHSKGFSR